MDEIPPQPPGEAPPPFGDRAGTSPNPALSSEPGGPPPGSPVGPPGRFERWMSDRVGNGVAVALILPVAMGLLAMTCFIIPVIGQVLCAIFGGAVGVAQLVYVVPLHRWATRRGLARFRKGLVIGASIVFLLNSACWGTLALMLKGSSFR